MKVLRLALLFLQRTYDIKSFRFAISEEINSKPGQFFVKFFVKA